MKKALLPLSIAAVIGSLTSCTEKGPLINFGGSVAVDTTYVADIEAKQAKMSLIEEFTGVSCSPCPNGHKLIYGEGGIKAQHPNQVAVIAYHIKNFAQAEPVHDHSKTDFRTDDASDVGKSIFGGIVAMPVAGIDRTAVSGNYQYNTPDWSSTVTSEVAKSTPVNVKITSTYDAATRRVKAVVKVSYTESVSKNQSLTLALIENKVIDAQKTLSTIVDDYEHNSVLRDIITPYYGDAFLTSYAIKEAGRVYQRTFEFNVNDAWKAENCEIVAFVSNNEGADKEVLQTAEVHVTGE